MAQETYDWSSDYSDEDSGTTTTFTSSTSDTVDIRVRQNDPNGYYRTDRDGFEDSVQMGGSSSGYFEMGTDFPDTNASVRTRIDFRDNTASLTDSVRDVSFTLFDIDATSTATFQDTVRVRAWDADGNPVTVNLTAVDPSVVSISGDRATAIPGAGSGTSGSVNADSTEGNVLVSIPGDVARIVIIYSNGPDAQSNPANQAIGFGDLSFDLQPNVACFTRGTRIRTMNGQTPIEELRVGDMVVTADRGLQPVRWIGSRRVGGRGDIAPVWFATGAIGNARELTLSPQHKVVIGGWKAELLFGEVEVMASALSLANGTTIVQTRQDEIEYFHFALDHHEIVYAEGAPCESMYVGSEALSAIGSEARAEMSRVFPGLEGPNSQAGYGLTARTCLKSFEAGLIA